MKGLLQMTPGVTRGIDSNLAPDDTDIPTAIGLEFNRNGRRWRVSVVVDTFIIGTAIDAVLDDHNEPARESDIIRVAI